MSDVVVPTGEEETITAAARPSSSAGVHAALGVLELLVARGSLTLAELARELGLAKSTLHRVCSVLVQQAWVVRDEAGRYELGVQALAIGSRTSQLPIVVAFRSIAAELLTKHDETVCLGALDGDDSVYVAIEETSHPVPARHPRRQPDSRLRLVERARDPRRPPARAHRRRVRRPAARDADGAAPQRPRRAPRDPRACSRGRLRRERRRHRDRALRRLGAGPERCGNDARRAHDVHSDLADVARRATRRSSPTSAPPASASRSSSTGCRPSRSAPTSATAASSGPLRLSPAWGGIS